LIAIAAVRAILHCRAMETRMSQETPSLSRSAGELTVIIALLTTVAPFSIDTYLPSFPDIGREFAASGVQMQQTLSLYLIGFAIMTLVYGPLSDAFGRRRVILFAMVVYVATSIGCAVADSYDWLLAMRIGQGVSASGGLIVGRAIVRDAFSGSRAQRAMSNVMLVFALAPAVAPIIGGWLHSYAGWRSVFWFLTVLGVFLWVLVAVRLPETLSREHRNSPHPAHIACSYRRALSTRRFVLLVVVFALNFGGFFLYIAGSPAVIYHFLHLGAHDFWRMFVPLVTCLMLGAFLSGRLAGRLTSAQTASIGAVLMILGAGLNVLSTSLLPLTAVSVIAPLTVYVTGMALSMPSVTLLVLDVFPHHRGLSAALQGFGQTLFNAVVAGVITPLASVNPLVMATTMFGLNLCAAVLWTIWYRVYRDAPPLSA
jgi:DHA1 family bicyclomycin/chloramphenicol resistance-like MFS transporter